MKIAFTKTGNGKPVVCIHGFPMDHTIWNDVKDGLSEFAQLYFVDLPGFGQSPMPEEKVSIESVAAQLLHWLRGEVETPCTLVGHSLGGYIALRMVQEAPDLFDGLVLMHSTALPDSEEKKRSRDKVLSFIDSNGVAAFTENFVQPLFADPANPKIGAMKKITANASAVAVKNYTMAMRDRADRQHVLQTFPGRVLIIGGRHDSGIPVESLEKQAGLNPGIQLFLLENSAHMGMMEEPDKVVDALKKFLKK